MKILTRIVLVAWIVLAAGVAVAAPPTISSVTPSTMAQGTTATIVIMGKHLCQGASVISWSPSTGLTSSPTWISPTRYDVVVTAAADAPTGGRTLTVRCGTESAVLANALTITAGGMPPPPPTIGLTVAEVAALAHLDAALGAVTEGLVYQAGAFVGAYTTGANHAAVGQALQDSYWVSTWLNNALGGFLGIVPETLGTPLADQIAAMSRAEQVALYRTYLDKVLDYAGRAESGWGALRPLSADPGYVAAIDGMLVQLADVRGRVALFDRTLPFATPQPSAPTPGGFYTIVGPHGDYPKAQWLLWRSGLYWNAVVWYVAEAVKAGAPNHDYTGHGAPFGGALFSARTSQHAMLVYSGARSPTGARFFDVLDALRLLTTEQEGGTPKRQHFLLFTWETYFFPRFAQPVSVWQSNIVEAMVIAADAWKHSDGGAWEAMAFPDCSILRDPTGCGGR